MHKCIVIAAGDFFGLPFRPLPGDFLIAADAGYDKFLSLGIDPDLIIGDFDSRGSAPKRGNTIILPCEKDVTDMSAACRKGMEAGCREFHLFGGTGGRLSHTMANIQLMADLKSQGADSYLYGEKDIATIAEKESLTFDDSLSGFISVFSFSDKAEGVSIKGLKYELEETELDSSYPLGVSNEFKDREALITVRKGKLLIIWQGNDTGKIERQELSI